MESGACATEVDSGLVMDRGAADNEVEIDGVREEMDDVGGACCDDMEVAKVVVEVEEGVRS
jgi:hypothetical protein